MGDSRSTHLHHFATWSVYMTAIEEILALTRTTTQTALSDDVLYSVLMTLPSAFVAAADGVLDDTERQFLFNMCDALADGEADDGTPERALLTADIYATIMGLVANRHEIEGPLFAAIREEAGNDSEFSDLLDGMLVGVAECSEGTSDTEQAEIDRLRAAMCL
jgi:hypothetical protein